MGETTIQEINDLNALQIAEMGLFTTTKGKRFNLSQFLSFVS
jgi:hypothetical protein